jgi:hypothetical protein
MTSTLTLGPEQQRLEGRTVRDIVEHDPAQVNEVWCRKIFRQLLQSLELQYAMHMPHRAITPDTVVFHDNGEPLLVPSDVAVPETEQDEAADLAALARVVHFAITRELAPMGPLHGRNLDGYSDSLITAVDRCMAPEPADRPHSIDELRHILGIVSLGPVAPMPIPVEIPTATPSVHPALSDTAPVSVPAATLATLATTAPASAQAQAQAQAHLPRPSPAMAMAAADNLPSFMREADTPRAGTGLSRWQRWAVAAGGGAVLIAIALALFAELRDSGSYDHIVLTLPQSGDHSGEHAGDQARSNAPAPAPLAAQEAPQAPSAVAETPDLPPQAAMQRAANETDTPPPAAAHAGAQAPRNLAVPAGAPPAARPNNGAATSGSAAYKLQIQPWGVVYVDGVDRGVSPPVKRLVLAPGRHTIRIANPNFHDRVLEVDTSAGSGQIAINFSDEPR